MQTDAQFAVLRLMLGDDGARAGRWEGGGVGPGAANWLSCRRDLAMVSWHSPVESLHILGTTGCTAFRILPAPPHRKAKTKLRRHNNFGLSLSQWTP